jgi:hypothetical protein
MNCWISDVNNVRPTANALVTDTDRQATVRESYFHIQESWKGVTSSPQFFLPCRLTTYPSGGINLPIKSTSFLVNCDSHSGDHKDTCLPVCDTLQSAEYLASVYTWIWRQHLSPNYWWKWADYTVPYSKKISCSGYHSDLYIMEVSVSNLGQDTNYRDLSASWLSWVTRGISRDGTWVLQSNYSTLCTYCLSYWERR